MAGVETLQVRDREKGDKGVLHDLKDSTQRAKGVVLSGRSQLLCGEQHGGRARFVGREHLVQGHRSMDKTGCLSRSLGLKREDFLSSV